MIVIAVAVAVFVFFDWTAWRGGPSPQGPSSVAPPPVVIGVAVGLTGANGVVAPTVVQSSQLAVDEINRAGGILGRRVDLVVADDASDPAGVPAAAQQLLQQHHADVVIAMETSAARTAMLPFIERARVPYVYTSFYEGHACSPWMYANGWVPEQQVVPVVAYLMHDKAARSVYLVGSDYAFGRGMLEFTRRYIESHGGRVAGEDYLPVADTDWSTIVARIRAAKPDALISATAGGAPNVALAKQLDSAGLHLPYGNLAIDESTARTMGDRATGMLMSASYLTSIDSTENHDFLAHMLIRFGDKLLAPNELSVPQYEAIHLYRLAAERAGTTESHAVLAALGAVTFDGPRGLVQMSASRHAALAMRLARVQADGSARILQTFGNTDPGAQCPGF
ncbi:MAG TPA: substrate-binding protein [Burkholderiaceae bacterium]